MGVEHGGVAQSLQGALGVAACDLDHTQSFPHGRKQGTMD